MLNMNGKQFMIVMCASMICGTICYVAGMQVKRGIEYDKIQAQINAQTEVDKTKVSEEEATRRTKERMNIIPWYRGGENK